MVEAGGMAALVSPVARRLSDLIYGG
jgi:hypothetical protein